MTGHANLGAGQTGKGGFLDRGVAVATINPVIADVMFVTEGNGLLHWNIDIGGVGRPKDGRSRPSRRANQNHETHDNDFGADISAFGKKLSHETGWSAILRGPRKEELALIQAS